MNKKQQWIDENTILFNNFEYKRYYLECGESTDYFVNHCGYVVSTKRDVWILMTPVNSRGYVGIACKVTNKTYYVTIHKMVIRTFLGDMPNSGMQIDHIDGDKKNNHINNLEWVTPSENVKRVWKNGLCESTKGDKHHNVKYSDKQILSMLSTLKNGKSILQCSKITSIPTKYIYRVIDGSRRKNLLIQSKLDVTSPWLYKHPEFKNNKNNN